MCVKACVARAHRTQLTRTKSSSGSTSHTSMSVHNVCLVFAKLLLQKSKNLDFFVLFSFHAKAQQPCLPQPTKNESKTTRNAGENKVGTRTHAHMHTSHTYTHMHARHPRHNTVPVESTSSILQCMRAEHKLLPLLEGLVDDNDSPTSKRLRANVAEAIKLYKREVQLKEYVQYVARER